ncbi:unnamed protein product [Rhodiola kirilowii]
MKAYADQHRTVREFAVGDMIYIRLQPYHQQSVMRRGTPKLAKRYYGPFRIMERIGKVAYRIELPSSVKVNNVFHVSLLKPCKGKFPHQQSPWPEELTTIKPPQQPIHILGVRRVQQGNIIHTQVLIQWDQQPPEDATWEYVEDIQ